MTEKQKKEMEKKYKTVTKKLSFSLKNSDKKSC